ncbi:hypothetical protein VTO73DRAFT_9385 [Trametes versicolor]
MAYRIIFTGECTTSIADENPTGRVKGKPPVSEAYGIREVTVHSLCYVAALTRWSFNAQNDWVDNDGHFRGGAFVDALLTIFMRNTEWTNDLLAWWNEQIFGDESSDLEDIIETDTAYARMLARDEQKKKAAKAAARAPTAAYSCCLAAISLIRLAAPHFVRTLPSAPRRLAPHLAPHLTERLAFSRFSRYLLYASRPAVTRVVLRPTKHRAQRRAQRWTRTLRPVSWRCVLLGDFADVLTISKPVIIIMHAVTWAINRSEVIEEVLLGVLRSDCSLDLPPPPLDVNPAFLSTNASASCNRMLPVTRRFCIAGLAPADHAPKYLPSSEDTPNPASSVAVLRSWERVRNPSYGWVFRREQPATLFNAKGLHSDVSASCREKDRAVISRTTARLPGQKSSEAEDAGAFPTRAQWERPKKHWR